MPGKSFGTSFLMCFICRHLTLVDTLLQDGRGDLLSVFDLDLHSVYTYLFVHACNICTGTGTSTIACTLRAAYIVREHAADIHCNLDV